MAEPKENVLMEKIVSLCKRRGFIYQSSEIYGGINGFWDYGPLGTELKRNVKELWWRTMVHTREDVVGLEATIIMHPQIWKASGHVDTFSDPMCDCLLTGKRFRADQVEPQSGTVYYFEGALPADECKDIARKIKIPEEEIAAWTGQKPISPSDAKRIREAFADLRATSAIWGGFEFAVLIPTGKHPEYAYKVARQFYKNRGIESAILVLRNTEEVTNSQRFNPENGALLTDARPFNLMFKTYVGPVADEENVAYLRPETAQAIFAQFKNVLETSRQKVPFGIAQIGKAFRNEVTPRNFTFRSREFEQMELEFFIKPDEVIEAISGHATSSAGSTLVSEGASSQSPDSNLPRTAAPSGTRVLPAEVADASFGVPPSGGSEPAKAGTPTNPQSAIRHPQSDWGWEAWHKYWVEERIRFYENIGLPRTTLEEYWQKPEELAHYARATVDILFKFPFGTQELEGIAARSDFDLSQHERFSGKQMGVFDEELRVTWGKLDESKKQELWQRYYDARYKYLTKVGVAAEQAAKDAKEDADGLAKGQYIPHVIEPSAGVDRLILALIANAYTEDQAPDDKGKMESRVVMKFHPRVAPIKVAVFPLLRNKPELVKKAREVRDLLLPHMTVFYDDAGAIGRRYRRQDEAGTPFGLTIDFETLGETGPELKDTVTLRDRDTMAQTRVKIDELVPLLVAKVR